jgi:predicted DCC family thiol-disulfide oxidoreductase YuxK
MTGDSRVIDHPAVGGPALTVIFDGYCGFCTRCAEFGQRLDVHSRVRFLAHQAPGVRERFGITRAQAEFQIWAIDAAGGKRGGAQAAAAVLDTIIGSAPWLEPRSAAAPTGRGNGRRARSRGLFERLAGLPGIEQGLDRAYQWAARNRGRFPGTTPWCQTHAGQCGR